jgi:hypothetical protein
VIFEVSRHAGTGLRERAEGGEYHEGEFH